MFFWGLLFGSMLGAMANKAWEISKHECIHNFVATKVTNDLKLKNSGMPITIVLFKCSKCGALKTEQHNGTWDLTDATTTN